MVVGETLPGARAVPRVRGLGMAPEPATTLRPMETAQIARPIQTERPPPKQRRAMLGLNVRVIRNIRPTKDRIRQ